MIRADVGIIGGTGLGEILLAQGGEPVKLNTPYGLPSDLPVLAEWEGVKVAFLARHGAGHRVHPSAVPFRANIWAMKKLGVKSILASGAVGSLREEVEPGHLLLCDQAIDKTYRRSGTFFDCEGLVAHVELANPFCTELRKILYESASSVETTVHEKGTYVCMEGPQFSTQAESHMHRAWGGDVIGMTAMPEAKLAREAEICYSMVALGTDYDCWRLHEEVGEGESVLESVLANLKRATDNAVTLIKAALPRVASEHENCACHSALKLALWTDVSKLSAELKEHYALLIDKYVSR